MSKKLSNLIKDEPVFENMYQKVVIQRLKKVINGDFEEKTTKKKNNDSIINKNLYSCLLKAGCYLVK